MLNIESAEHSSFGGERAFVANSNASRFFNASLKYTETVVHDAHVEPLLMLPQVPLEMLSMTSLPINLLVGEINDFSSLKLIFLLGIELI